MTEATDGVQGIQRANESLSTGNTATVQDVSLNVVRTPSDHAGHWATKLRTLMTEGCSHILIPSPVSNYGLAFLSNSKRNTELQWIRIVLIPQDDIHLTDLKADGC